MITHLEDINKAFESKVRLGIMSVLMVNDEADFNTLKELLGLTDGNLASHTRALENLKYIKAKKQFVGRKPKTTYSRTKEGEKAFQDHLQALEAFLKNNL
ncbi:MAG: transcriptional regulator [Petrimonas sp.]|nr:transcriptional regulator [Petrimonas sp.]